MLFRSILGDTFPDNLILSHDLLEGNYLRVGYVSDVELIDDAPSDFLTDVSRQHRWARGDTQIIGWLLNTVKNKKNLKVKNPINLLGKLKILDNILRMFLMPSLLLILLFTMSFSGTKSVLWTLFVVLEIAISIIFFLYSKVKFKNKNKTVYYKNLLVGGRSLLYRAYIALINIPFYTGVYMDAFFRTLYRLFVSHKNLLNWTTAEEASKKLNKNLVGYLRSFIVNYVFGIIFIILGVIFKSYISYVLAVMFITAPFILYFVSLDIKPKNNISSDVEEKLTKLAYDTWMYFSDNLCSKYNYLIPDNYQENREEKLDNRTSPTAIGYSLVSVVSACEMEFITTNEAKKLISNILDTVEKLDKWNGHLYNWYNILTMEVINPR